jgi:hypothetical protein
MKIKTSIKKAKSIGSEEDLEVMIEEGEGVVNKE